VRIGVTQAMIDAGIDAIAVVGLADLHANRRQRRKIQLPEYQGHLWLGDHGCFWCKHQENDQLAMDTYNRIRAELITTPNDYEDVEAILVE
jgi:hypothetical protein